MTMELQLRYLAALPPRDPEPLLESRMAEALRLTTVNLTPPEKFSCGSSWVFQLELFFAASTEFQWFPDHLQSAVTLFRDGALKWWRNVYNSVDLTSRVDFYA